MTKKKVKQAFTLLSEWISWEFDVVFPRGGLTLVVTTFAEQDSGKGHRGMKRFFCCVKNVSCVKVLIHYASIGGWKRLNNAIMDSVSRH